MVCLHHQLLMTLFFRYSSVINNCYLFRRNFFPTKSKNAEVFFLLKSPSRPCPIASCKSIPGHPGPKTTVCSPAGISFANNFTLACLKALLTASLQLSIYKNFLIHMSAPKPKEPVSIFPFFSTETVTFILTRGLES